VRQEALFPKNSKPIFNRYGIALGFVIEERGRLVVVLPGVPGELIRLFRAQIRPLLKRKFPGLRPQSSLIVKTVGLSEPTIMKRLGRSFFGMGPFEFGIYPDVGEVAIRIYANSKNLIGRLRRHLVKTLGQDIYSFSDDKIEAVIGKRLVHRRENVSIAESCTGGRVSEKMTRISGASRYFTGAIVAYQNIIKLRDLGVTPFELRQNGAVSREVALSMANEIRKRFLSTLGVAVTGIAGPTGGTTEKPVGLVYIAIASSKYHRVWKEQFQGDRAQIQNRATEKVLEYLWRWLRK
jgi:nicotinamide-nucleotide amidase